MANRQLFAFAVNRGERSDNPARAQQVLPPETKQRLPGLTTAQVRGIIGALYALDDPAAQRGRYMGHGTYALLAAIYGRRGKELCGLRWSDIDFDGGSIRFHDTRTRKRINVPLTPDSRDALIRHRELLHTRARRAQKDSALVFSSAKGGESVAAQRIKKPWKAVLAQVGIPAGREAGYTFHDLRRFVSTRLDQAHGTELSRLIVGHKDVETHEGYFRATTDERQGALNDLSAAVAPRVVEAEQAESPGGARTPAAPPAEGCADPPAAAADPVSETPLDGSSFTLAIPLSSVVRPSPERTTRSEPSGSEQGSPKTRPGGRTHVQPPETRSGRLDSNQRPPAPHLSVATAHVS